MVSGETHQFAPCEFLEGTVEVAKREEVADDESCQQNDRSPMEIISKLNAQLSALMAEYAPTEHEKLKNSRSPSRNNSKPAVRKADRNVSSAPVYFSKMTQNKRNSLQERSINVTEKCTAESLTKKPGLSSKGNRVEDRLLAAGQEMRQRVDLRRLLQSQAPSVQVPEEELNTIFTRLSRSADKQKLQLEKMRAEKQEEELRELKPKPTINDLSKKLANKVDPLRYRAEKISRRTAQKFDAMRMVHEQKALDSVRSAPEINERSRKLHRKVDMFFTWDAERHKRLERARDEAERKAEAEATFQPCLSYISRLIAHRHFSKTDESVEDRLIKEDKARREQLELRRSLSVDRFQPSINERSRRLQRDGVVWQRLHSLPRSPSESTRTRTGPLSDSRSTDDITPLLLSPRTARSHSKSPAVTSRSAWLGVGAATSTSRETLSARAASPRSPSREPSGERSASAERSGAAAGRRLHTPTTTQAEAAGVANGLSHDRGAGDTVQNLPDGPNPPAAREEGQGGDTWGRAQAGRVRVGVGARDAAGAAYGDGPTLPAAREGEGHGGDTRGRSRRPQAVRLRVGVGVGVGAANGHRGGTRDGSRDLGSLRRFDGAALPQAMSPWTGSSQRPSDARSPPRASSGKAQANGQTKERPVHSNVELNAQANVPESAQTNVQVKRTSKEGGVSVVELNAQSNVPETVHTSSQVKRTSKEGGVSVVQYDSSLDTLLQRLMDFQKTKRPGAAEC